MGTSRLLLVFTLMAAPSTVAWAREDCAAQAVDKRLSGSELESFMASCQNVAATAGCEVAATEKKLEGKARKAFVKECAKDTLGK